MDLNAVQMFVSVVQAGSLSAAAERMGTPLPTLSRRIRELERQLNVQLLERSVRGTRLTDAGTRLYEHASRGIETLTEAEQAVASDQAGLKGRLRLSLPPAFEPWWHLLSAFQQLHPDIRLHIYTTERRVDLIEDGIDVALRVGTIAHESMVARRVLSYRHVLVASPRLTERLGVPGSVDELHRFPCAVWSLGANTRGRWQLGEQTIEPDSLLATNDYAHLCNRALAGEVITELPPFLAATAMRAGQLVALLPTQLLPEQQINLLYPSHRHPSAIVRAYLDFCQQQVSALVAACATIN
jgi:DNA-binding transcriptional LysR family regulator